MYLKKKNNFIKYILIIFLKLKMLFSKTVQKQEIVRLNILPITKEQAEAILRNKTLIVDFYILFEQWDKALVMCAFGMCEPDVEKNLDQEMHKKSQEIADDAHLNVSDILKLMRVLNPNKADLELINALISQLEESEIQI